MRRYKFIIVTIALTAFLVGGQLYCLKCINYGADKPVGKNGFKVESYELHMQQKGCAVLNFVTNECRENEEYKLLLISEEQTYSFMVKVNSEGMVSQKFSLEDGTYNAIVQRKCTDGELQNAAIFSDVCVSGGVVLQGS